MEDIWYPKIRKTFDSLKEECNDDPIGSFQPVLEDDFLGRIYHHFIINNPNAKFKIFLKTRINPDENKKYDLVIGNRVQTTIKKKEKVYVEPELIAEFKVYPYGFSTQQLSKRREGALKDIEKLSDLKGDFERAICLFDQKGWLKDNNRGSNISRLDEIKHSINEKSKPIKLIVIRPKGESKEMGIFDYP